MPTTRRKTGKKPSKATLRVGHAVDALDALAPREPAQDWDNVGLLVGDRSAACAKILCCIDLTPSVLDEAIRGNADLLVAYHPPIFKPFKRVLADSSGTDALVHRAIASGIAIYSPHTALDAAPGGTNDVLAGMIGLTEVEPFDFTTGSDDAFKIVTFVPHAQLEKIASAMFAAGGGRIGDYEQCSYRLEGQGTFFGTESTDPAVGRRGRLEKVSETRMEMVAHKRRLPEVIDALLRSHPYEEPGYDIYPLVTTPTFGLGRVGQLPKKTTLGSLAGRLKKATGSSVVVTVGDPKRTVKRAAICVGSAGRLPLEMKRSANADVIVTGEIRHHDALTIQRVGKSAVALGHWESERPVLDSLVKRLGAFLPGVKVMLSKRDTGPFRPA